MSPADRKMTVRSTNNERLMAHSRYAVKTEDPSRATTRLGRMLRLRFGHHSHAHRG
jgi:hypothetical protein